MRDPSFLPLLHGLFYPFFFCGLQGQVEGQSGRRGGGGSLVWLAFSGVLSPHLGLHQVPKALFGFVLKPHSLWDGRITLYLANLG